MSTSDLVHIVTTDKQVTNVVSEVMQLGLHLIELHRIAEEMPDMTILLSELIESACLQAVEDDDDYELSLWDKMREPVDSTITRPACEVEVCSVASCINTPDGFALASSENTAQIDPDNDFVEIAVDEEISGYDESQGTAGDSHIVTLLKSLMDIASMQNLDDQCAQTGVNQKESSRDDIEHLLESIYEAACSSVPMLHRLLTRRGLSVSQWQREVEDSCMLHPCDMPNTSTPALYKSAQMCKTDLGEQHTVTRASGGKHDLLNLPLSQNKERLEISEDIGQTQGQLDSLGGANGKRVEYPRDNTDGLHTVQKPTLRRSLLRPHFANMKNVKTSLHEHVSSCTSSSRPEKNDIETDDGDGTLPANDRDFRAVKRRKWQPPKLLQVNSPRIHAPNPVPANTNSCYELDLLITKEVDRRNRRRKVSQFSTPRISQSSGAISQVTMCEQHTGDLCLKDQIQAQDSVVEPRSRFTTRFDPPSLGMHASGPSAAIEHRLSTKVQETGWSTAGGKALTVITRDPKLAAEWDNLSVSCRLNTEAPRVVEKTRLDKNLAELQKDVKAIELAHKVETQGEDSRLSSLIVKWRRVSQEACEEIHSRMSARMQELGGLATWKQLRQSNARLAPPSEAMYKPGQDDFALTTEEAELMGIEDEATEGDEGYTMSHLLAQLDVPRRLIRWDPELEDWY